MVRSMEDVIVACVRTGTKYDIGYVRCLRNMVGRHLRPTTFVCLTDMPERCEATIFIDISDLKLPGWWGKMALFDGHWRTGAKVIYLDLDTVVCGSLEPLTKIPGELSMLESPVRLAGNLDYPCRYNSSVMVIGAGQAGFIWTNFERQRGLLMAKHARYGDQAAIEELYPYAPFLQRLLPGFFLNYRYLTTGKPKETAVVNFGGNANRPHNCAIPWIVEEWR